MNSLREAIPDVDYLHSLPVEVLAPVDLVRVVGLLPSRATLQAESIVLLIGARRQAHGCRVRLISPESASDIRQQQIYGCE